MHRIALVWKFSLSTADWTGFVPGFFYNTSEIQLEILELCAFGPLENKAFGIRSLKMSICWVWSRISFVCEGCLDQGLQKALPESLSWTVKETQMTNCFMEIKSPQLQNHSKAGVQNRTEKEADVPGPTHTIKCGAQAKFGSVVTII